MLANKTTVAIIDDEVASISVLESLLNKIGGISLTGKFTNSVEGLEFLKKETPDLVFLDLEMPGLTGIELLRLINVFNLHIHVIIITAHQKLILQAAKYSNISYLLKPIDFIDLKDCLKKYASHQSQHSAIKQVDTFLNYLSNKIKIPTSFEELFFAPDEIYFLEADGNYTKIQLISGQTVLSSFNLGRIHQLLPDNHFYRISRSCIINYTYIKKIDKRKKVCVLNHLEKETEIPYSKAIISRSGLLD